MKLEELLNVVGIETLVRIYYNDGRTTRTKCGTVEEIALQNDLPEDFLQAEVTNMYLDRVAPGKTELTIDAETEKKNARFPLELRDLLEAIPAGTRIFFRDRKHSCMMTATCENLREMLKREELVKPVSTVRNWEATEEGITVKGLWVEVKEC